MIVGFRCRNHAEDVDQRLKTARKPTTNSMHLIESHCSSRSHLRIAQRRLTVRRGALRPHAGPIDALRRRSRAGPAVRAYRIG